MPMKLFVCGKSGSGKSLFAERYAKQRDCELIMPMSMTRCSWYKRFQTVLVDIDKCERKCRDYIFYWDFFEHCVKESVELYYQMQKYYPDEKHIVCSLYPPEHFDKRVESFITREHFVVLELEGNWKTPKEEIEQEVGNLLNNLDTNN